MAHLGQDKHLELPLNTIWQLASIYKSGQVRVSPPRRSQSEFPGAFKMVDFQSIFGRRRWVLRAALWPFERLTDGLQNFFQPWYKYIAAGTSYCSLYKQNYGYTLCLYIGSLWKLTQTRQTNRSEEAPAQASGCEELTNWGKINYRDTSHLKRSAITRRKGLELQIR